jgi:hypothetical protein
MNKFRVSVGQFTLHFSYNTSYSTVEALNDIKMKLSETASQVLISDSSLNDTEFVTKLLNKGYSNVTLASAYEVGSFVNRLRVTYDNYTWKLCVYGSTGIKVLYDGALTYFDASKSLAVNFLKFKNKLVRFYYEGGTDPGVRVVKVNDYRDNVLHCIDIVKNAPRNFLVDKVKNLEEVTV